MTGRHAPRSKNGCTTCRRRKVKCGEERPVCIRCSSLQLVCDWGATARRHGGRSNAATRFIQPARPRWSVSSPTTPTTSDEGLSQIVQNTPILSPTFAVSPHIVPNLSALETIFPPGWTFPTPLYPSLSETGAACSNSLVLSERDQQYFQYFPSSSVVFYYIKNWQWSSFSYLYQGPAIASKLIMRMILALSASDMHRNGLAVRLPGHPTAEDHGRYHYGRAVKEFRQLLETPRELVSQAELETIFATMFLMICYEWQFGESVQDLQLHLRGVRSLLESHPLLFENKDVDEVLMSMDLEPTERPKVSFIPEQLLLWILYIESGCRTVGMTDSLYDFVLQSGNQSLHPDRLYRCARLWGRCFWGQQYPDQEVSDDIENYRGLELLHTSMNLRHKIWQAFTDDPAETELQAKLVWAQIMSIREQFSDLFLTAKLARIPSTRRTLITIYMAVSLFYAHVLFHRRLLTPPGPPSKFHRLAVTNIIEITKKQYESDPRLMRRLHWPILMAAIETEDTSHREWLQARLTDLRQFHSEYLWASEIADEILSRQDASNGIYADVAALLRQRSAG